ncbi:hypothetical protein ACHAXR_008077 [Thalassiosira sp. AJA248-18]
MSSRGGGDATALCASCDRCRARKTRCDGQRPCSACKQKYMKKHKLMNVAGVDPARFECFYSPAKRRGPVPGHKQLGTGQNGVVGSGSGGGGGKSRITRKRQVSDAVKQGALSVNVAEDGSVTSTVTGGGGSYPGGGMGQVTSMGPQQQGAPNSSNFGGGGGSSAGPPSTNPNFPLLPPLDPSAAAMQQHVLSTLGSIGLNMFANIFPNNGSGDGGGGGGGATGMVGGGAGAAAASSSGSKLPAASSSSRKENTSGGGGQEDTMATAQNSAQAQLAYIQQLQLQQQIQAQQTRRDLNAAALANTSTAMQMTGNVAGAAVAAACVAQTQSSGAMSHNADAVGAALPNNGIINAGTMGGRSSSFQQLSTVPVQQPSQQPDNVKSTASATGSTSSKQPVIGCEHISVQPYIPLLQPNNPTGLHLRACYTLSVGGLFGLPSIPTDEEYCRRFDFSLEPHQLPKFDVAALQAARFAELAMGALADTTSSCSNFNGNNNSGDTAAATATTKNNNLLLVALANASILCLRDCVEHPIHPSLMFDVARTYLFHAIFRSQLDNDMERYFKYRRVCLRTLAQLDCCDIDSYQRECASNIRQNWLLGYPGVETLMAATSFQDSLAYMINSASEGDLPNIDSEIPRVSPPHDVDGLMVSTDAEKKYGIGTSPSRVASNPINQMWIQGAPPVLINEDAPARSRILDALACAIRSSLDEAKSKQTKDPITQSSRGRIISRKRKFLVDAEAKDKSVTEWALEHHPEELSSVSLLATASHLLKTEEEASAPVPSILIGHRLLVSALNVTLNMDRETENSSQLQASCHVLEGIVERPSLLFQGGPTYHIINNCAIFLAHKINTLYPESLKSAAALSQFEAALNVYHGSRMVLEKHRNKLPHRLRCHEIPKPDIASAEDDAGPVIDFSQSLLCPSRNCLDCVTVGMTAAETAKRVASATNEDKSHHGQTKSELEKEFDVNDRALLGVLSQIISQEEKVS